MGAMIPIVFGCYGPLSPERGALVALLGWNKAPFMA